MFNCAFITIKITLSQLSTFPKKNMWFYFLLKSVIHGTGPSPDHGPGPRYHVVPVPVPDIMWSQYQSQISCGPGTRSKLDVVLALVPVKISGPVIPWLASLAHNDISLNYHKFCQLLNPRQKLDTFFNGPTSWANFAAWFFFTERYVGLGIRFPLGHPLFTTYQKYY